MRGTVWKSEGGWGDGVGGYIRFLKASTMADRTATVGRAFHSAMVQGKNDFWVCMDPISVTMHSESHMVKTLCDVEY